MDWIGLDWTILFERKDGKEKNLAVGVRAGGGKGEEEREEEGGNEREVAFCSEHEEGSDEEN